MKPAKIYITIALLLVLWMATSASALDCPHCPSDSVPPPLESGFGDQVCMTCHVAHVGYGSLLTDTVENLCLSCHNPSGAGAEVSSHRSDDGACSDCGFTFETGCTDCHEPHGNDQINYDNTNDPGAPDNLLRAEVRLPGTTTLVPYTLEAMTGTNSFADGDPAQLGICEVCHTQTLHHDNTGDDQDHYPSQYCIQCHAHADTDLDYGFRPSGCTGCHNEPQPVGAPTRRQIVGAGGDFERTAHHVDDSVISDGDCTVCHYTGDHQSGTVKLNDPDNSTIYSFDPLTPTTLGSFCVNCHDYNGADGNTAPFSGAQPVPNMEQSGVWAASAHGSNFPSCYGNGTNGCHGNAHGSNLLKLLQPFDGSAGTDNVNQEEGFCYNCHGPGGTAITGYNEAVANAWIGGAYRNYAQDIESAFGMYSSHPVNDSVAGHTFDLGQGAGPQELECTSCHGVHRSTGKYWDAVADDTPVILPSDTAELWGDDAGEKIDQYDTAHTYQAPSIGDAGNNLNGDPLPIDGSNNSLLTDTVLPDYNSMCLECHQYAIGGSIALDYPNQDHGSEEAEPEGPSEAPTGFPLKAPYDSANRGIYYLNCMNCHEAHGSDNGWLIRQSSNGAIVYGQIRPGSSIEWNEICNDCHDSNAQARHHNDDVYTKVGSQDCSTCHDPFPYVSCIKGGCHGHEDRF